MRVTKTICRISQYQLMTRTERTWTDLRFLRNFLLCKRQIPKNTPYTDTLSIISLLARVYENNLNDSIGNPPNGKDVTENIYMIVSTSAYFYNYKVSDPCLGRQTKLRCLYSIAWIHRGNFQSLLNSTFIFIHLYLRGSSKQRWRRL